MPSFAAQVKKELTELPSTTEESHAELAALIRMNGSILVSRAEPSVDIQTENAAIARRMYTLLGKFCQINAEIVVRKKMKLKKNNVYIVRVSHQAGRLLEDLGILGPEGLEMTVSDDILAKDRLVKAYLRGAFLAGGSVNNPKTSSYHLEIYSFYEDHSRSIQKLMNKYDFNARTIERRSGYITYLKEADKISDFLALIGASKSTLSFENVRVTRNMRNSVNRRLNCENANLNKTVDAAQRQIANINYISDTVGLNKLPEKLQAVAAARLDNPYFNLKQLGQVVPGGPLSKSAVNHRLRKIDQYAKELKKKKETGS